MADVKMSLNFASLTIQTTYLVSELPGTVEAEKGYVSYLFSCATITAANREQVPGRPHVLRIKDATPGKHTIKVTVKNAKSKQFTGTITFTYDPVVTQSSAAPESGNKVE